MELKTVKVQTQKMQSYRDGSNEVQEKYINLGYEPSEEVNLENLGYHFTPRTNFASIQATGLRPKIGSNSSGAFGREALEKTFFSYGKKGVMQLFNRLVSACCEVPISGFMEDSEKMQYLLNYQKAGIIPNEEKLTILEGLECARRYMDNCSYFCFSAKQPQYTKEINEETVDSDLMRVNQSLDALTGIVMEDKLGDLEKLFILQRATEKKEELKKKMEDKPDEAEKYQKKIDILDRAESFIRAGRVGESREITSPQTAIICIDQLVDTLDKKEPSFKVLAGKLSQMRAQISIGIREKSKDQIDAIRGKAIPNSLEQANFERIDYNEDMCAWIDVKKYPHNAHTMIIERDGEKKGVIVSGDTLSMLSLNGKKPATAIDLTKSIYENSFEQEHAEFVMNMPGRKRDDLIIEDFYKYVELYTQYKGDKTTFKAKMREFEAGLIEKYKNNKIYNLKPMQEDRMEAFVSETTKEQSVEK